MMSEVTAVIDVFKQMDRSLYVLENYKQAGIIGENIGKLISNLVGFTN